MEKNSGRSLLTSLSGEEKKDVYSASESRRRQSEKWIALQAEPKTSHEEMRPRLDPVPKEAPIKMPQTTYVRQLNDKIDRLIAVNKARTKE